jgi:hypothetical protein
MQDPAQTTIAKGLTVAGWTVAGWTPAAALLALRRMAPAPAPAPLILSFELFIFVFQLNRLATRLACR